MLVFSFQLHFCCPCTIMYNGTGAETASPAADYRLPRSQGIAYVSAYVVGFVFIIMGNVVVLAVFGKTRQLRQRKSHWLLINQTFIDFLAGSMMGPVWVYYYLAKRFDLWDCCSDPYLTMAADSICFPLPSASNLNLMTIALERMFATLWPMKHRALTAWNYRVVIGLVWPLSLFLPCVRAGEVLNHVSSSTFYFTLMSFTCCIFLLIVLRYASIWIKLKCFSHPSNNLKAAQERKLTASLFLVMATSLMTYLPGTVLFSTAGLFYVKKSMSFISASHAKVSGNLLTFATLMINPIVYSFRMPGFRRAALRLVCRRPRTENNQV